MKNLYIGTSGYNYKHWKEIFYPKGVKTKDWLNFYSQTFNSVEINATFYGSFKPETFIKWKASTPNDFCFSIKGSRLITHVKKIKNVEEEIKFFYGRAENLSKKLGCVLWQFPKSFRNTKENFYRLCNFIKLLKNINAIEFRDSTWFTNNVFKALNKNDVAFVINDTKAFDSIEKITGNFVYIRLHGPGRLYSSYYSVNELKFWASKIKKYLEKYNVFCYFNNDSRGFAVENSRTLRDLIFK